MYPRGSSKFVLMGLWWCVLMFAWSANAQTSDGDQTQAPSPRPQPQSNGPEDDNPYPAGASPGVFLRNFAEDQRQIWTSPFKARIQDLNWLVPFAGVTAGLINADAEISSRVNTNGLFPFKIVQTVKPPSTAS